MASDFKSTKKYYWQHSLFIVLLLALCAIIAGISLRYSFKVDLSSSNRNTLSEESQKILAQMTQPLQFSVFASDSEEIRKPIQDLIERYKRYKPDIQYSFIDPNLQPALVRESKIQVNGEVILHYGGKSEHLRRPSEAFYSNAMQRVLRTHSRWLLFLTGHGEREPNRQANHDLSDWVNQLTQRGLRIQSYQLANNAVIPDNTAALVIAGPQVDYLPGEVDLIKKYLDGGGNLFWLMEPGSLHGLEALADYLHIEAMPGIIIDKNSKTFGIKDKRFLVVAEYPKHPVTEDLAVYTLFPEARGLKLKENSPWQAVELLKSSANSWIATDANSVEAAAADSQVGAVTFGLALIRPFAPASSTAAGTKSDKEQRVIVVGDGDFLSNSYLGNVGNMELGFNMMNWLNQDDNFLHIPVNQARDKTLDMDDSQLAALGIFYFLVIPLGFLIVAISIWYRHRNA